MIRKQTTKKIKIQFQALTPTRPPQNSQRKKSNLRYLRIKKRKRKVLTLLMILQVRERKKDPPKPVSKTAPPAEKKVAMSKAPAKVPPKKEADTSSSDSSKKKPEKKDNAKEPPKKGHVDSSSDSEPVKKEPAKKEPEKKKILKIRSQNPTIHLTIRLMKKTKRNQLLSRKPNQQRNNPAHLLLRTIRRKLQKSPSQLRNNKRYLMMILILVLKRNPPKLHLMRAPLMNLVARKNRHPSLGQKKKRSRW